jgi:chromosome segregation ATPase
LDVAKRVDSLGSSFNGFSKKVEERLSGYEAKIKDVEKVKNEIKDEFEKMKSEFSADFTKMIEDVKKSLNERLSGYDIKIKEIERIDAKIKDIEKIRDLVRVEIDKTRGIILEDFTKMIDKIRNDLDNIKKEKAIINEENIRKIVEEKIEKTKEDLESDIFKEMNENMRKFSKFIEDIISEERKAMEKQSREIKEALREKEKFFKSGDIEKFEKLISELENRVAEIQKNIDEIQARIPVIIE